MKIKTATAAVSAALLSLIAAGQAGAAQIYPVDQARFMTNARFDFKIELDKSVARKDITVQINGADYSKTLSGKEVWMEKEDNVHGSALVVRDVEIKKPGRYEVIVKSPEDEMRANWDIYTTPEKPVAKNVIILLADGLSVGHRTAARILSKGVTNGMYNAPLAMDDMPHMALLGTSSVDTIAADSANTASAYMDGWVDRHQWKGNTVKKFPNQPDLTESFDAAVKVLDKNKDGFFLMLEAGLVDKYSHPLDWTRSVGDTIAFDKVVERAKAYCAKNPDTLLIVTGDHTHSISVAGTVDDNKPGKDMREKVGVYADAGYPNYEDKDKDGFPDNFQPSKRLAVFFGAHPDYYETYRSYPDATFNPAVKNEKGEYVADARYKDVEGGHFVEGNLPRNESQGVHTVDDLVVTAQGPNAEQIRGFMNSTEVFRVMAEALALGK